MVAVGIPFQEIAVIARELAVDLVVIGGHGRSGRGPIEQGAPWGPPLRKWCACCPARCSVSLAPTKVPVPDPSDQKNLSTTPVHSPIQPVSFLR